jgi:hypothetical protein
LRFSVIVRPFHKASTRLPLSSASLAFQSMGLNSTSAPRPLGRFTRQVDVETDQLVLLVAETHRRKIVVEADDDPGDRSRLGRRGLRRFLLATAKQQDAGRQRGEQQ